MDEILELLAKYQWIYNFKLTNFFLDRVWENIPTKWTEVLMGMSVDELNNLPFGKVKDKWPDCFKLFISKCLENSLPREQTLTIDSERVIPLRPSDIGDDVRRGMSQKKLHEVCHMTTLIDHVTRCTETRAVVDVGSGLGYLGQVLHHCYGYQILGLEGKQCHTSGAEKRSVQTVRCPGLQNVTCELHQNTASKQEFMSFVQDWLQNLPRAGSLCSHQTDSKNLAQCRRSCLNSSNSESRKQKHYSGTVPCEKTKIHSARCKRKSADQLDLFDSKLTIDDKTDDSSHRVNADIEGTSESNSTVELVIDNLEHMEEVLAGCASNSGICDNMHSQSTLAENSELVKKDYSTEDRELQEEIQEIESKVWDKLTMTGSTVNEEVIDESGSDVNSCYCNANDSRNSDLDIDIGTVAETVNLHNSEDEKADVLGSGCEKAHSLDPESEKAKLIGPVCEETGCVCMVGLHCCGDLTPTMLRYFVELDCVRGLCCVSCCYHRMNFNEASNQFENFPMSQCVQEAVSNISDQFPGWFLDTYAMRLAAQETRARWHCQNSEDHDFHTRNVAYRALLEVCLDQGHYVLKKTARKLAHRKDHSTYQTYVDKVIEHIVFRDTEMEAKAEFRGHMMDLYNSYKQYFQYIEAFTALQFLIQPVLESLIHQDRQQWLKEQGYHSTIVPVFDEAVSPRNLALLAVKC